MKKEKNTSVSSRAEISTDLCCSAVVPVQEVLAHEGADPAVHDQGADDAGDHEDEDDGALVVLVPELAPVRLPEAEDVAAVGRQACCMLRYFCFKLSCWKILFFSCGYPHFFV